MFVRVKVPKKIQLPVGFAIIDGEWTVSNVEVLTVGQQTVIPPSMHPSTKRPYEWVPGPDGVVRSLYDTSIEDVPRFEGDLGAALQLALTALVMPKELIKACKAIASAANGERNTTFNCEVFKLASGKAEIEEALARKWLTLAAHHVGLEEAEIAATFKSAAAAAADAASKLGGKGKAKASKALELVSVCAANIKPTPISWVWHGRLARGKQTCIAGEPGAGKSQVLINITATITTGGDWPCGEGKAPLGNVVILSAEDSAADTLIPRLIAAGADLNRVHIVKATRTDDGERHFNLKTDLAALEAKILEVGEVVLVGIDPVSSYMGETDAHRNTSVRAVLDPVSDMADRVGVAVVTITHFRKEAGGQTTKKALHRFLDSIAFVAGPRACFAVIEDAEEPTRRLFLAVKHSLTALPVGLAFKLREKTVASGITTTLVVWDEQPVEMTADQALAEASRSAARSETRESILQALEDAPDGGMKPNEIAADLGIKAGTVRQRLLHMVRDDSVAKDRGGNYYHPSRVPPLPDLQSKVGEAKRTKS